MTATHTLHADVIRKACVATMGQAWAFRNDREIGLAADVIYRCAAPPGDGHPCAFAFLLVRSGLSRFHFRRSRAPVRAIGVQSRASHPFSAQGAHDGRGPSDAGRGVHGDLAGDPGAGRHGRVRLPDGPGHAGRPGGAGPLLGRATGCRRAGAVGWGRVGERGEPAHGAVGRAERGGETVVASVGPWRFGGQVGRDPRRADRDCQGRGRRQRARAVA